MTIKDSVTIKRIVRSNFDKSADLYEQFEQKYGLFKNLTVNLAEVSNIGSGMRVCDIGCGTGTSSYTLQKLVGNNGEVLGVDFSEEMLRIAQEKRIGSEFNNLNFILCDADELEKKIKHKLDSILYNACIFLIPEPIKTLRSAYKILNESGTVGMNYLIGMFDTGSNVNKENKRPIKDLFILTKEAGKYFAPYGRRIMDFEALTMILKEVGFKNIREGTFSKEMSLDELKTFYGIPAQSAAFWPKNNYEDRLIFLNSLVEYFIENNIKKYHQHWGWCVGEKF